MDYQNIRTDDFMLFIQFLLDIFDLYDDQTIEFINRTQNIHLWNLGLSNPY